MSNVQAYSLFSDFDIELFKAGKHFRLYEKLGSHPVTVDGKKGTYFAVWAPSAKSVSVVGDFNYWLEGDHKLNVRWDGSGIWEGFIPEIGHGTIYKYKIQSHINDVKTEKADPFARRAEHPPKTASAVYDTNYKWKDSKWMKNRSKHNALDTPFSVYEVHLGSWKKTGDENRSLSYTEMADDLVDYVKKMEFTHVEFMPIMEYPYDPSWGYQLTGYFAPTSRFGYPEEFMLLVDKFHQAGIGVILDWVPSHFPEDAHGLGNFDGSHLYEHPDPRKGWHPDWKSLIFNYGRNEVRAFLISNALFWLDQYHIDGLRVDAVASMLYLDYSREDGEWEPNQYGGRENLDAIAFLEELNVTVFKNYPDVQTIAEESTSYTGVSKPVFLGGLGFGMKWMMGWMHDTLEYFKKESVYRKYHQNDITFSMTYAFSENFMLPLSHDEVVYGKKSLFDRMPGTEWQRFANLRLMFGYMFTHPGTNLIFQGGEFAQSSEWNFQQSLDWHLLEYDFHKGIQACVTDLNKLYKSHPALYEKQFSNEGFEWIEWSDSENSVLSYLRKGNKPKESLLVICNFTPVPRENYRVGIPSELFNAKSKLTEVLNTNKKEYGGSGDYLAEEVTVEAVPWNSRDNSIKLDLAPLATMVFAL
ncbi:MULTISPECIES: 1,4-alpha-glucan branching protein GlgB [unclassified Leeuwenhoekiella]|uniref:1,4-alpha-glucan branching protein GlgB n=1 Tax=unclassified Leeuwenhoekiella TaxID=2615029 RepID=UPI000C4C153A|nr:MULTISPECIES: 1,4-alpha-glucan branching protein GlgB [unclassified Leeuwenhoekiella]MAW95560.1 1,4-alpha-glucan branching enzyme [Leeuwenhoekiella sp.]MBA82348.1 1,4-alpha-glucan branching enzyme [Leeuwenhoekiella sp.]|tara:strand:- start:6207 stop:8126 length:1920 start_codon:yes stop_codon:yes gene_type:complete